MACIVTDRLMDNSANPRLDQYDDDRKLRRGFTRSTNFVRLAYQKTHLIWVAIVVLSVAVLAAKQSNLSPQAIHILDSIEIGCIIAFDAEIAIRIFACLPDWRSFFAGAANSTDTVLALVSTVILIPVIRDSPAYPWLTVFAIARFYRFIIAIPRMRRLLVSSMFHQYSSDLLIIPREVDESSRYFRWFGQHDHFPLSHDFPRCSHCESLSLSFIRYPD